MKSFWLVPWLVLVSACTTSAIDPRVTALALPQTFQHGGHTAHMGDDWLDDLAVPELATLVEQALTHNYALAAQRARVAELRSGVRVARSALFPQVDLALDGGRRRILQDELSSVADAYSLGLSVDWELDVWRQLGDAARRAELLYAAERARLAADQRQLVAELAQRYFAAVEATQLVALFEQRYRNLERNLEIIESGYRAGLNEALDVYLTRNSLATELANLEAQRQALTDAKLTLQLMVADYPDATLSLSGELPELSDPMPGGLPSGLLTRRPDLRLAWLDLLAADASVAIAHKDRFPRLGLTASVGQDREALDDLLSGGPLAWSAAAAVVTPLYQAGRLRALEAQARARLQQAENAYLLAVFDALAEAESVLANTAALEAQYRAVAEARRNAEAALELANGQYQRGLVGYLTVLESQRRAFDAQTAEVRLDSRRLQNRVAVHQALGGSYDSTMEAAAGGSSEAQ